MSGTVVLIPTYDERESLPRILERLHAANPDADALVIDDASPDGTGELADGLAADDARIHVLHRSGKQGLGAAYLAGFAWALARDYDLVVEMDADGSHPPETLPAMLALGAAGHGLVIGSRWVRGGSVVDWPRRREVLSRGANAYARVVLGGGVHDMTAGFRVYRADLLRALPLDGVVARGYGFQIEMTLLAIDAGADVVEVPIVFREREVGVSKMSGSIIGEAFTKVAVWGAERRVRQVRTRFRR